jgi:hypothetical protein
MPINLLNIVEPVAESADVPTRDVKLFKDPNTVVAVVASVLEPKLEAIVDMPELIVERLVPPLIELTAD